jgi:hypothetical protein
MRSVDDKTDTTSKESRCRLWCSIFMLEHFLSTMTGRPSGLNGSFFTHAPVPFAEHHFSYSPASQLLRNNSEREKVVNWTLFEKDAQTQARAKNLNSLEPSQSLYFFYLVDLSLIASNVADRIYGGHALQEGLDQVERTITLYTRKLNSWLSNLNSQLAFTDTEGRLRSNLSREQVSLALFYYSTCIILNRPCLNRPGFQKDSSVRFPRSRFGNNAARACLRSSLSLLAVLPDNVDSTWFYTISPWWTMLHFLMQATTVLLIHLAVSPVPVRTEEGAEQPSERTGDTVEADLYFVLLRCEKALRWLHYMARNDLSCQQGFKVCYNLLCRITARKGLNVTDLPQMARNDSLATQLSMPDEQCHSTP